MEKSKNPTPLETIIRRLTEQLSHILHTHAHTQTTIRDMTFNENNVLAGRLEFMTETDKLGYKLVKNRRSPNDPSFAFGLPLAKELLDLHHESWGKLLITQLTGGNYPPSTILYTHISIRQYPLLSSGEITN